MYPEDEMMPFEEDEKPEAPKLSKKARKARDKLSVAELKVRCHAPPSSTFSKIYIRKNAQTLKPLPSKSLNFVFG